ncbi:MAG: hypothetical protein WD399_10165 [Thermoleophilaceae bacterium]
MGPQLIFVPRDADDLTLRPIDTLGGEDTNEITLQHRLADLATDLVQAGCARGSHAEAPGSAGCARG